MLVLYAAWTGLGGVRSLGRNLTPLPTPRDEGELVMDGMFARVRHPLYASVMAMGFGWALLWSSRLALGPAAALALYIHAKALHEERLLRERFSEYPDYSARVPRYLPRFLRWA
jgi:protein-S-isoprenylcysteine O-methyltransferase Ste14